MFYYSTNLQTESRLAWLHSNIHLERRSREDTGGDGKNVVDTIVHAV
jgi:hypothetical protein